MFWLDLGNTNIWLGLGKHSLGLNRPFPFARITSAI